MFGVKGLKETMLILAKKTYNASVDIDDLKYTLEQERQNISILSRRLDAMERTMMQKDINKKVDEMEMILNSVSHEMCKAGFNFIMLNQPHRAQSVVIEAMKRVKYGK